MVFVILIIEISAQPLTDHMVSSAEDLKDQRDKKVPAMLRGLQPMILNRSHGSNGGTACSGQLCVPVKCVGVKVARIKHLANSVLLLCIGDEKMYNKKMHM